MDSDFKNKLLHYEFQPPREVWDEIVTVLDGQSDTSLGKILFNYQLKPDARIWSRIEDNLPVAAASASVIPVQHRFTRALRYTGVAAIVFGLALVTNLLVSKKSVSEEPLQSVASSGLIKTQPSDTRAQAPVPDNENSAVKKITSHSSVTTGNLSSLVSASLLQPVKSLDPSTLLERFMPHEVPAKNTITNNEFADKYMIYSDEQGHAVRLPKKLFDAFACSSADLVCKQRLRDLQQKIASSALTADFNGVLDMLNNLKENQ